MRTRHLLLLSLAFCLLAMPVLKAQSNGKLKAANEMKDRLNYIEAIEAYNKIIAKPNAPAEAFINLAECYLKVSDIDNAEYMYSQVVTLPEAEPVHYLYYGYMLQRNGKCDMAKEWYEKYVELAPDDNRGQNLLRACDYEDELMRKNAGIYELEHMPYNTGLDDFGPMYFGNGIVYASENGEDYAVKRLHCWTGNPFLELFYVEREEVDAELCDFTYGDPEKFSTRLNSKYHDAVVAFTEDQNTIYFTRNNLMNGRGRKDDEGVVRLKIYSAENKGGGEKGSWTNLQSLPFNSDEYSVAHPALTPDGKKLYFASDMPGGFGGMDLYVSEMEGEQWGPPINLGSKINTEGHEVFPYFGHDGMLYFSSDGHVGLGGLDIYYTERKEGFNEWGEIINIGAPVNSRDDDFGYIINEEKTCGYFTSDREGGFGGDDIYSFRRNAATVKLLVYDEKTGEPIEGAEVVSDCTGNTVVTGADGTAMVEQRLNQCCMFTASKEEYEDNEKEGCTTGLTPGAEMVVEIPLKKASECLITGRVHTGGTPLPGVEVFLEGTCEASGETVSAVDTTDAAGMYMFELEEGCCYTVSTTPEGFFKASVEDICTTQPDSTSADSCKFIEDLAVTPLTAISTPPGGKPGAREQYYDENGNPIDHTDPRYFDPDGNPIPGQKFYDENGTPVTPRPGGGTIADNGTGPGGTGPGGTGPGGTYPGENPKGDGGTGPGGTYPGGTEPGGTGPGGTGPGGTYPGSTGPGGISGSGIWDGMNFRTTEDIIAEAARNEPIECCSVFEGLNAYFDREMEISGGSVRDDGTIPFLLHIYYDFDQSYIRDDAEGELQKLYNLLTDNPTIIVEIGSHTDSRGSHRYNDRLSQRRAEAVVRKLKDMGIGADRLQSKGYGETMNVNNCANNVPCSEAEHQLNRRTEFRVVGLTNGVQYSTPRQEVSGQGCQGCPF